MNLLSVYPDLIFHRYQTCNFNTILVYVQPQAQQKTILILASNSYIVTIRLTLNIVNNLRVT